MAADDATELTRKGGPPGPPFLLQLSLWKIAAVMVS
jgi:hypothetical protein